MNARLPQHSLSPDLESIVSRVPLLPDEPTFNYVTRLDRLTGGVDRQRIVTELFGKPGIRVDRPFHGGFGHFAEHFADGAEPCPSAMARDHSMLGLFRPFVAPERFERALKQTIGDSVTGVYEVIGARATGVFRESPGVCLKCVEGDIRDHRPPHYQRVHQVIACQVCPEHGTPLTTICASCGVPLRYTELPSNECHSCGATLEPGTLDVGLASNPELATRLAKVIQWFLNSTLTITDEACRLATLRERTRTAVRSGSGAIGDNLALRLTQAYGPSFLDQLGLAPNSAPRFGWPALMIHGRLLSADPIANSLLIALLFESVDDYARSSVAIASNAVVSEPSQRQPLACSQITRRIVQDALGPERLADVAQKHGLGSQILTKWVAAYPGLSERRRDSGIRIQLRRCKRKILTQLGDQAGLSRTQVALTNRSEIAFVLKHDRAWLDFHLPRKTNLSGATARRSDTLDVSRDREFAEALRMLVTQEMALKGRPRRLSPSRVLRMSGLEPLPVSKRLEFRETLAAIDEASESVNDYYKRCLDWAAADLERCRGRCDHLIELFIHAGVSVEHVRSLEAYASALIISEQQAAEPLSPIRQLALTA